MKNKVLQSIELPGLLPTDEASRVDTTKAAEVTASESDVNIKILFPVIDYVSDKFGKKMAAQLARRAGLDTEALEDRNYWIPIEQMIAFFIVVRELLGNDEDFKAASVYKMKEAYGPLRFLIRAVSLQSVFRLAMKHFPAISKISTGEIVSLSSSHILYRYWSKKKESRLICLGRQAQAVALPTFWGLPPAHLKEKKCICRGDDRCEYELRVYQTRSWSPIFGGAISGGIAAFLLFLTGLSIVPSNWVLTALPVVGGLMGYVIALRQMNKKNFEVGEEINEELRTLVRENVDVKLEIMASNRRQSEWSHQMEEQVAERTAALENVVRDINRLQEARSSAIRGYSHDLKNPFFTISLITENLMEMRASLSEDARVLITEQNAAVTKMKQMLDELVRAAVTTEGLIRLSSERLEVEPLVEILRKRVRAFVHGRDIRVSVFSTRNAPREIETDRLLFDRVADNLLTNAAKYTEQGSIVVELDGKPDFLIIKISDTGRGIEENNIKSIFMPGGSDPEKRKKGSHGVGLSVVVQLLAQIGGHLEVMSLPGKGTSFHVYFPIAIQTGIPKPRISKLAPDALFTQVVKIRKVDPL